MFYLYWLYNNIGVKHTWHCDESDSDSVHQMQNVIIDLINNTSNDAMQDLVENH